MAPPGIRGDPRREGLLSRPSVCREALVARSSAQPDSEQDADVRSNTGGARHRPLSCGVTRPGPSRPTDRPVPVRGGRRRPARGGDRGGVVWANSPWPASYASFWSTPFDCGSGRSCSRRISTTGSTTPSWRSSSSSWDWRSNGNGRGELRDRRAAALPALAALGGMVVPAGIYLAFNAGGEGADGWGIPMATDIAFALGVVALLGSPRAAAAEGVPADSGHRRRHRRHRRHRGFLRRRPHPGVPGRRRPRRRVSSWP